jgi:short-subunit dehydrogenase
VTDHFGKSAVVTGASSGIGEALARLLAARGFDLVLVARGKTALDRLASELSVEHSVLCEVLPADLTSRSDVEAVAAKIRETGANTVVNNAGFGSYGLFHELAISKEVEEVRLNVEALVVLSHAALEVMVPRRSGSLLNVASTASFQPGPKNATYAATKAFVRSFTEALHEEVLASSVHVTALCPGFTRTAFMERAGLGSGRVPGFMWAESMPVAVAGLEALQRNDAVCIPGFMNKVGAASVRLAPRFLARKLAGQIMRHV